MTSDAINFQKKTAKALVQELTRLEEVFSFHGRPAEQPESAGATTSSSQTVDSFNFGRLECAAIGIDCRKYSVNRPGDGSGKGAFTVLFPTLEDGIPFQPIGEDPRRILEAEQSQESTDSLAVLQDQLSFFGG